MTAPFSQKREFWTDMKQKFVGHVRCPSFIYTVLVLSKDHCDRSQIFLLGTQKTGYYLHKEGTFLLNEINVWLIYFEFVYAKINKSC